MKNKKQNNENPNVSADEFSLADWKKECREMEAETEESNAEIRQIMEQIKADDEMDPEVRKAMLDTGEKILGMDRWMKEFNATTSDIIAQCDAFIAKAERLEKKAANRKKKGGRK